MKTAYRLQELEKEIAENKGMIPKLEQQIDACLLYTSRCV